MTNGSIIRPPDTIIPRVFIQCLCEVLDRRRLKLTMMLKNVEDHEIRRKGGIMEEHED